MSSRRVGSGCQPWIAGDAVDEDRLGLHREAEVVGEAGDLAVLHAGVGLELERGDDRARMDLGDLPLDRELAAFLLELCAASINSRSSIFRSLRARRAASGEREALFFRSAALRARFRPGRKPRPVPGFLLMAGVGFDRENTRFLGFTCSSSAASRPCGQPPG
jgi:hypothetical protein